eukprot:7703618-Pyramimonas_sp.AAC.1
MGMRAMGRSFSDVLRQQTATLLPPGCAKETRSTPARAPARLPLRAGHRQRRARPRPRFALRYLRAVPHAQALSSLSS